MATKILRFIVILAVVSGAAAWCSDGRPSGEALRDSEVMALVAEKLCRRISSMRSRAGDWHSASPTSTGAS